MLSRVLHVVADIHFFLLSLLLFRCIITHFLLKEYIPYMSDIFETLSFYPKRTTKNKSIIILFNAYY